MQTKPTTKEHQTPWMFNPRLIGTALRRFWTWMTIIHSNDPLRLTLNQGFAYLIIFFNFISVLLIFALFASGEIPAAIVSIVALPVQTFMWWLNRRGTVYGAVLYVLWAIAAITFGSPPASYAGANAPIPLLLIFPIIIATLFIRPQAGLWALILMMTALGVQLSLSDVPREHAQRFLIIGTLDLAGITVLLMVGASIFSRALRASIAANESLIRQQEQFHYAALATQDAIYDWDLRANTVIRNEAYQRLYGANAVATWWESHVSPDDHVRVSASIQDAFRKHSDFWSDEYQLRRFDEQYATVVDRAYIFYDSAGQPIRMIGAMTDITERKRAEAEHLELALARERAALLKEFFDTVSHDLKTPLTIINSSLYLLENSTDPRHQKNKLEQIKGQVEYLGRIIQDLLTISRLDAFPNLVFQSLDINQMLLPIQAQFQDVVKEKHLILTVDLDPNLSPVWGNEVDLNRAFVNLVENALRYTPSNGTVTIRTLEQADQVAVEVRDTGIGIDEGDLSHIFESFYRTEKAKTVDTRGTGLGLAIVQKTVNRHHGNIEVMSSIGEGSTFRMMLPITLKPPDQ